MESEDVNKFMFATQTHVMSDELLNALDLMIDLSVDSSNKMCEWCLKLLKTIDVGDEYTVTAEQAQWLIANAQKTFDSIELEEGEEADSENLDLIIATFDDYANFIRIGENDSAEADISRIIVEPKDI